jgi:hypothetical protein
MWVKMESLPEWMPMGPKQNSESPAPGLPVPPSASPRLAAIAAGTVRRNGGNTPQWVSVVVTTRDQALASAAPGSILPGSGREVVYLMTMKGAFTAWKSGPPVAGRLPRHPTGTYLSLVIDAKTLRATSFGLRHNPPPVAPDSLGPVTYLSGGA